jgi:PAS domain S-box-containing protein
LQLQIDRMPIGCMVFSKDSRIQSWNPAAERIFGFSEEEVVGRHLNDCIVPPDLQPQLDAVFARLVEGDETAHSTNENLTKDGRRITCEWTNTPLRGADGKVYGILSMAQDITERKQEQEALRVSEERFRGLFEQAPIGAALLGSDHRMSKANPAFCRMLGYSEAEMTKMTPLDITLPDDRESCGEVLGRLDSGEIPVCKLDKRYVKKNGEIIWISLTASVIRDREGRPLHGLGLVEDITERKRVEEELRSLSERLSLATRTASIGIWDLDLRTNRVVWDDTTFAIFDIPRVVPLPQGEFARRVHPEDLPAVQAARQRAVQEKTQESVEFRIIRPDGSMRHVSTIERAVLDELGNAVRLVGTAVDITVRKEMEAQIEASARLSALGMMAGGVAHEINNPLAIIHASAGDLLRRAREEGAVPVEIVVRTGERILQTANRITKIIKSMRHLAREGSRDRPSPTSVAKIVEETLEICKERFKNHSVNLLLPNIDPALCVSCREVQIEQVLLNLLQNAFDAVVEQAGERWVRLDVAVQDGSVAFSVIDSGPGIPPELRTRIMEPFFTTKEVGKGAGLGLSLSRTIVEEHGGTLELTEVAGHNCFSFRLALAQQTEPACK